MAPFVVNLQLIAVGIAACERATIFAVVRMLDDVGSDACEQLSGHVDLRSASDGQAPSVWHAGVHEPRAADPCCLQRLQVTRTAHEHKFEHE